MIKDDQIHNGTLHSRDTCDKQEQILSPNQCIKHCPVRLMVCAINSLNLLIGRAFFFFVKSRIVYNHKFLHQEQLYRSHLILINELYNVLSATCKQYFGRNAGR